MKLKIQIMSILFLICCLPFAVWASGVYDDDLTHGFLDSPLPPEIMQYTGTVNGIDEENQSIIINDTLYSFTTAPLLLTPGKSPTTLKYFTQGMTVAFFSHVKDHVIYELMATNSPKKNSTKNNSQAKKANDLIFENGVWHN